MGIGNIFETNITNGCSLLWQKVPQIPSIPINLQMHNKPFINFVSLIGVYAFMKSSIYLAKKSIHLMKKYSIQLPSTSQLQQKYGEHSWILISDCRGNEQYCILFGKMGFNLIICGQQEDIKIAIDRVIRQTGGTDIKVQQIIINWKQQSKHLKFYQQLDIRVADFDISIIVLPLVQQSRLGQNSLTHDSQVPVFQHIYLLVKHFGQKLKWRPNTSGIILPSSQKIDQININENGMNVAVQSGVDAFGRALGYELKGGIEVVVARGGAQKAVASLGKFLISH